MFAGVAEDSAGCGLINSSVHASLHTLMDAWIIYTAWTEQNERACSMQGRQRSCRQAATVQGAALHALANVLGIASWLRICNLPCRRVTRMQKRRGLRVCLGLPKKEWQRLLQRLCFPRTFHLVR